MRRPRRVVCTVRAASCAPSAPPIQIPPTTRVNVSRVISESIPPRPSDCAIETLSSLPAQPYRELGAIEVPDGDLNQHNTLLMIHQNACSMGADAIVVSPADSNLGGGPLEAIAIAYASNLAARAAHAPAATAGDGDANEELAAPTAQLPQAQELPPAAMDQSSSGPDSSQPNAASAPITEQQIGPAEAPSPTPTASPSAVPEASPAELPSATLTLAPAAPPTATPSLIPTASPSPTATRSPTPTATPSPSTVPAVALSPSSDTAP